MRAAPPARAPSRSAGPWAWFQQLLWLGSVAVAVYWAGAHLEASGPGLLLGGLALGGVAAVLAGRLSPDVPALLAWDGTAWSLCEQGGPALPGQASLMLDLGGWVLVRFMLDPAAGLVRRRVRWLPLSQRDAGAGWSAMRIALHNGRTAAHPGAAPPARPSA